MARLHFFEGRNTGIYAPNAKAARAKCRRGCGKLVKVIEKTPPKGGAWDRTRPSGKQPKGPVKNRGYGPSKAASAKAVRTRKSRSRK